MICEIFGEYCAIVYEILRYIPVWIVACCAGYAMAKARNAYQLAQGYREILEDFMTNTQILNKDFATRIKDLEFQVLGFSQYLKQKREESMASAIKSATENPEKYMTGAYAFTTIKENPNGD